MKWFALLPAWLIVNLAAYLLAPVLPLFARLEVGPLDNGNRFGDGPRLPSWLSWLQTPDNSLDGDHGWRTEHCPDWASYWGRVKWLWRNPACGFDSSVLNAQIGNAASLTVNGNPYVQDAPKGQEGRCYTTVDDYWNLVYVKRLGARCIKLDLGWQLKTFAEQPVRIFTQTSARYALSIRFPLFKES